MFAVLDVAVEEMLVLSVFGTSGGTVSIACPSEEDAIVDQIVVSSFGLDDLTDGLVGSVGVAISLSRRRGS